MMWEGGARGRVKKRKPRKHLDCVREDVADMYGDRRFWYASFQNH